MKVLKKVEAWAVLFTPEILEKMVATDNHELFTSYAIFENPTEAVRWMNEKWLGGADLKLICKVEISIPCKKLKKPKDSQREKGVDSL